MGSEIRKARDRATAAWTDAVQASYENVAPHIGVEYMFRQWSGSVSKVYTDQWLGCDRHEDSGWDWHEIARRHRSPKEQTVALLSYDKLCALAHFTASRKRVLVRFLEGNPRPDCHMKGCRALLMLDLATTYGQRLGNSEIHLQPVNPTLAELYRSRFGFVDGLDDQREPILKRSLS